MLIHAHSPLVRYLNEVDEFWFILNLAFFFNDDDDDDDNADDEGDDYGYHNVVTDTKVDINFKIHFCFLILSNSISLQIIKGKAYNLICLFYLDH